MSDVHGEAAAAGGNERPRWVAAGALALGAMALLAIRLDRPGFFDNEGRYAEVAREMLLRGDLVTPEIDFTLFLNKPPLTYWLAAGAFALLGTNEWARLVTVLVAGATIVLTCRLGARLFSETTGLLAGFVLATMLGFVLEARTLRPDMAIVCSVVGALWCWVRAESTLRAARRSLWLVGMYVALGLGVMAKGLVPLALALVPIGLCTLRDHGLAGLGRLRPLLGLLVLGAVVLPWHVAVALRHPGFAWDFVVNQHLLFFLDRKFPRDSEGDALLAFWLVFVARASPWVVLLPLVGGEGWRGRRSRCSSPAERASFLCWAWLGGVLGLFSLAPSRLEHYSLPALPAAALLGSRALVRLATEDRSATAWRWLAMLGGLLVAAGAGGAAVGKELLFRSYWIAQVPAFGDLALPAAAIVFASGLGLVLAAMHRRAAAVTASLSAMALLLAAVVVTAMILAEPLFSWKPAGILIRDRVPAEVEVVFESPEEYQLVGGLVFYAGRRITLLELPGFIPPTYLEPHVDGMFLSRAEFVRRWTSGERLVLVSDPQRRRESPEAIVPPPHEVLGRFGDRWVLATFSLGAAS